MAAGLAAAQGIVQTGIIASKSPPSFQTEDNQIKVVPGPRNAPVNAVVHGGELIGRPGGGMGGNTIMVMGDFLETDETANRLSEIIFGSNKNIGSPTQFTVR